MPKTNYLGSLPVSYWTCFNYTVLYYVLQPRVREQIDFGADSVELASASTSALHFLLGWSGGAKVSCSLHHQGIQLILAYSWARPAPLVAGKGRGGMFLFLLFLHFCSSDRYMIHLYCLAVQAGFYSDMVECWPVTGTAQVWSPVAALVIRIFSPVISGAQRK